MVFQDTTLTECVGLQVFAAARRASSMSELKALGVHLLVLDVTNMASIQAARDQVQSLTADGSLDLLVNCAGVAYLKSGIEEDLGEARAMFETNVFGVMAMVQEFFPLLSKSKDACILNVGSLAGLVSGPFGSTYNASKAALHAYSDTLRLGGYRSPFFL
jgi:1-acylglycerone phosphate reductase